MGLGQKRIMWAIPSQLTHNWVFWTLQGRVLEKDFKLEAKKSHEISKPWHLRLNSVGFKC